MRLRAKHYLTGIALLTLTMPVWAKTYKQSLTITSAKTIAGTQLKPGDYDFSADESKKELEVLQKGKVVATVPGQWVKIPQKPQYSTYDSEGDKITQVEFAGTAQAFQVQ